MWTLLLFFKGNRRFRAGLIRFSFRKISLTAVWRLRCGRGLRGWSQGEQKVAAVSGEEH
jgi:hypothetical protein